MKAKDTVINGALLRGIIRGMPVRANTEKTCNRVAEAQAEITWPIAKKAGIQEVIAFTEKEFGVDWSEETRQLKKWGVV